MTAALDATLATHLNKGRQEDLTFAYWRPSRGASRYTAVLSEPLLPEDGDRILQGNVAFTAQYLQRALRDVPAGCGLALLHSHPTPRWQGLSDDDRVAEAVRMGGAVAARTGLPVLGLTWGNDGSWSARIWLRKDRHQYEALWASSVRVLGSRLRFSFHPTMRPPPPVPPSQVATLSVWGRDAQNDIARTRVGIVGLGSVGSIVAETLARVGVEQIVLIDHDRIEERNLDRTLNAYRSDAAAGTLKVAVAEQAVQLSHTAAAFVSNSVPISLCTRQGVEAALDCDVIFSCVDRPWPRAILNAMSKSHLVPIVDGGILARVTPDGHLLHVDWRIHTVGPGRQCLYCLGALRRSDVALDMEGMLDNPDYVKGLSTADRERYGRRNVLPFSLSVAAHEVLQFVGLVAGAPRVAGIGPQHYAAYPGELYVEPTSKCEADCEVDALAASAVDLTVGLPNVSVGRPGADQVQPPRRSRPVLGLASSGDFLRQLVKWARATSARSK